MLISCESMSLYIRATQQTSKNFFCNRQLKEMEKKMENMERERETKDSEIRMLMVENDTLKKEKTELMEQHFQAQKQLQFRLQEIEQQTEDMMDKENAAKRKQFEEFSRIQKEFSLLQEEKDIKNTQISSLQEMIAASQQKYDLIQSQYNDLSSQYSIMVRSLVNQELICKNITSEQ